MATDLDRELLETVAPKRSFANRLMPAGKIQDFFQKKDEDFQDFAENYTEKLRKFFGQNPRVSEGDKFGLSPEDEVVVTPEGIGPLMYGRSKLGDIGDRLSSGIGSLKEFLQYYFGNPKVNVELLDYIDSMRSITNNLEQATEALYPVFQKMNPSISYAKLREILLQRGFVPSRQTEEDFLPETIIRPQPEMAPEMPFSPSPPPERFQPSEGIGGLTARNLFEMGEPAAYALMREKAPKNPFNIPKSNYTSPFIEDLERRGAKISPAERYAYEMAGK